MSFHNCKHYEPKDAKVGDKYKCICGVEHECVRRWPWRKWVSLLALVAILPGCAALQTTLDILSPDPVPVCDKDSVGVTVNGDQCIKLSDDSYRWRAINESD